MDYSSELTDAQPPNTEAVFQSVTEELQEMKHKYETEMLRVLEDQERAQEVRGYRRRPDSSNYLVLFSRFYWYMCFANHVSFRRNNRTVLSSALLFFQPSFFFLSISYISHPLRNSLPSVNNKTK